MRRRSKEQLKSSFFKFVTYFYNIDSVVNEFWLKKRIRICAWYMKQHNPSDMIISASPEFLLQPIADQLHVTIIASNVDKHTGIFLGKNCHGEEKVKRFLALHPTGKVEKVYSDSKSDLPLFMLGKQAYMVNNKSGTIKPYTKQIHFEGGNTIMKSKTGNNRNEYIDCIRGITTINIIAIHTAFWAGETFTPEWFRNLTLLIDVPLFFYLSGWASSLHKCSVEKTCRSLVKIWMKWIYFFTCVNIFGSSGMTVGGNHPLPQ